MGAVLAACTGEERMKLEREFSTKMAEKERAIAEKEREVARLKEEMEAKERDNEAKDHEKQAKINELQSELDHLHGEVKQAHVERRKSVHDLTLRVGELQLLKDGATAKGECRGVSWCFV